MSWRISVSTFVILGDLGTVVCSRLTERFTMVNSVEFVAERRVSVVPLYHADFAQIMPRSTCVRVNEQEYRQRNGSSKEKSR